MKEEEIDKLITESLDKEEAEFYNNLEEKSLFKMWGDLYTGKLGWVAILMSIVHTIVVVLCFYCGYKLFVVEGITEIIRYGVVLFIALAFGSMIKLWHWMQMDKNSILREVKRLEFQIAMLTERITNE
ncbi:hypothetical protein G3569_13970 [Aliifodinibius halophilus]|uniref:Uncharacterized protein n=2 Tax=Fodinibius halophilus TaxID=1736908 RepID=A0A6M1TM01_9BACT|nr:hypothetical protein [Fodinibius halophilus]